MVLAALFHSARVICQREKKRTVSQGLYFCMKKKTLSVLLFVITFIATYTILCFALPGAKMALGTTTLDRIWVAITCMAWFKVVVSLVVASIVGVLPMIVGKRE